MANARPGGPRRPGLDYYEYKRLHEQRFQQEAEKTEKPAPVKPARPVKPPQQAMPEREEAAPETPVKAQESEFEAPDLPEDALDLPEDEDEERPGEKKSLFTGMKALMKGVSRRVPEEDEEPEDAGHEAYRPPKGDADPEPEDEADGDEDEIDPDAPQIDNPIGDALKKVGGLFRMARVRLAERRGVPEADEEGQDDEDADEERSPAPHDADAAEPVLSRRMRKAAQAQEPASEPPILDIEPVDVREVDELVSQPGTTVHTGFAEDEEKDEGEPDSDDADDEDDEDDDLPSTRGTRLFGFFKKFRGRGQESQADEPPYESAQPDGEDQFMDENQKAALTQRLSEELESAPSLSRKERKALAAGSAARSAAPAVPAAPAVVAPAAVAPAAVAPLAPAPVKDAYAVDEPTQEFRPLRVRAPRPEPVRPTEPEEDDYGYDEEDEDDDLPVRRAPKPPKEKKRRVYQDEDLDEEDYDDGDRYGNEYDDYDEYDEYDDYDEDDERYDDEYHVSGGRRFLGFLKGLVLFVLFLAVCVLALRQLEASRLISLGGLRDAVGQLSLILPSPEPTAMPEPTPMPAPEVTAEPTQAADAAALETPGADIAQVETTPDPSTSN